MVILSCFSEPHQLEYNPKVGLISQLIRSKEFSHVLCLTNQTTLPNSL